MIRAQAVAVDFAWITAQSQLPHKPLPKDLQKLSHAKSDSSASLASIMVIEKSRPITKTRTRGHEFRPFVASGSRPTYYPLLKITNSTGHSSHTTKKRRKKVKERLPAAFWRPDVSIQRGKALGYALGYPGSWSARYDGDPRKQWYVRDTMRKGIPGNE
ncbi:hypothetical protein BJ138DRAFT_1084467 [Hygrophoropsis aurantiaca]|uniref:Uncharacterized protein n=1 Tax=Hygrophoropsis aurantiaca TaxID=72124 RepID=A0ACB8AF72_9AGAM|nr:hypothetical protein BJ138DRAFT_1084467 [Hygrophoropsis aurantiaca]